MSNTVHDHAQQIATQIGSMLNEAALDAINGGLTPEQSKYVADLTATSLLQQGFEIEDGHTSEEFKELLNKAVEILKLPRMK